MVDAKSETQVEPTVFVVDDDEAIRKALSLLLKSVNIISETYESAQEFLDAYDPSRPGCLVLDVRMPGMSGLDLQKHLADKGITIPIVIITGHGDVPMAVEAVKMGAVEFIEKPFRDQVLLESVQKGINLDAELRVDAAERAKIAERLDQLTTREKQVMELVVAGKPNKAIASELELSQKTVEFHRAHVMEKSGANSVAELVRMALKVSRP